MTLANGAVLGLMHRDLPVTLQPSAVSWRIATLLHASGSILFAVQGHLPHGFVLPLANGMVMFGFAGYWRALRQFYGRPESLLLLLLPTLGTLGVFWFSAISPSLLARVVIVSIVWAAIMLACIHTLRSPDQSEWAKSRRVLAGIFFIVVVFTVLRAAYFMLVTNGLPSSILDNGSWLNVLTPIVVAILPVIGTTAFLLLCSERIRRQWERAASTDYLTGLPNRRTLANAGDSRFETALESGQALALAMVDIDHFKQVNDRYGHEIGDRVLKHVAARLESACRGTELPARQGGEEFVVLFERVDAAQALRAGERLRQAVEAQPFATDGLLLPLTVSVGIVLRRESDRNFDDLLRRADEAMYAAKSAGRNRVEIAK